MSISENFTFIAAAFPWFFPVCAAIYGAIVGSFLNVVIYRMPLDKSIIHPGSQCACGAPIKWRHNIPILSWFWLRGRAACCGRPYSFRYPFVEMLTAGLFLACWWQFPPLKALCCMLFVACLVCATFIDLDHMIIPDEFTIGLGVLGVFLAVLVPELHGHTEGPDLLNRVHAGSDAVIGMLIGSGLLIWIAVISEAVLRKDSMGFGDVKLIGAIGVFTGWQGAVFAIFGGAVIGTVWVAVAWVVGKLTRGKAQLAMRAETPEGAPTELAFGAQVPFGPMLAAGGVLHLLLCKPLMDYYLAPFAVLFQ